MNGKENKKLNWRNVPAVRILSVALSALMALSLMPCEGLAWALAREEVAVQADDVAGALADEREIEELAEDQDAKEALTEDQGDIVADEDVVEEADHVESVEPAVEEPAAAKKDDGIPEWAVDDDPDAAAPKLTAQAELPTRYDLREYGVVTPVKSQAPWGSCWSFGATAAAETSILSAMGETYDSLPLDLSEHHLAYFAMKPITDAEDPTHSQMGEGLHLSNGSTDYTGLLDSGGDPFHASTLFAMGAGPFTESVFPYRGKNALTEYAYTRDNKQALLDTLIKPRFEEVSGKTLEQYMADAKTAGRTLTAEQAYEEVYEALLNKYESSDNYCSEDDWSIPDEDRFSRTGSFELTDGNLLPDIKTADGQRATKQELLNGRGVAAVIKADDSRPGENGNRMYLNQEHWAQYCDEDTFSHAVCIVGWDDNYPVQNFNSDRRPNNPGAWLAKNSWGSETDAGPDDLGNVVNKGNWGELKDGKHTGYFWISYEDKSIRKAETYEFSIQVDWLNDYQCLQYDYMPAQYGYLELPEAGSSEVISTANVFEVPDDREIKALSAFAPVTNTRITLALYLLDDKSQNPTDGQILYRTSKNCEYAGYHRFDVDLPVTVNAGDRIALVSTASTVDANGQRQYKYGVSAGYSETYIQSMNEKLPPSKQYPTYAKSVVNEGESFLYRQGAWQDWTIERAELMADGNVVELDNFGLKVYTVSADHAHAFTYSASGDTITATCGGAGACDVTEGLALTIAAPADLTYDGRAKAATIVGGYSTTAFPGGHAIRYYRGGEQVKASDVVGAGDYVATLTAGGATASVSFAIERAPLTSMAKVSARTYAGKAISPTPAVRSGDTALAAGTDFSYSYKSNAAPGTATVTATGKGNYRGTVSASFKIGLARPARPATTAYPSKGEVVASWGAVKGAKSYQLQWRRAGGAWQTRSAKSLRHTVTGLKAGALCEFRVRAVAGSVTSAWSEPFRRWMRASADVKAAPGRAQGSVTATWGADKAATGGYKVFVYSKKGGELLATRAAKAGATSATVGGLRSGRTYYVRVRPYRVESGTTYTGVISGYRAAKAK